MLRVARLFRNARFRGYAWGKMRADPVFAAGFELLRDAPNKPVLDIGCGLGLFAFYLRERGFAAPVTGVDLDGEKIRAAQGVVVAGNYGDVTFTEGDVLTAATDADGNQTPGHVVIFDVLHYLAPDVQARLLEHAADRVAPGGMCLIRATPRDGSWRFRATQWEETFIRLSRWVKSDALHYLTVEQVAEPFRSRRFSVEARPLWGRTPFNSYLFVFRAPAPRDQ